MPYVIWAVVVALFAGWILGSERSSERDLERRYSQRAAVAARFVESYAAERLRRQDEQAGDFLSGPTVSRQDFERAVQAFGYQAAVLLDAHGRALQVYPAAPRLIGRDLSASYEHLATALRRTQAVSGAVPSAALRRPIVAFAVPYESVAGLRVFSAGNELVDTPLAPFLRNITPIAHSEVYLIDAKGAIIDANRRLPAQITALAADDPALAAALTRRPTGLYKTRGERWYYTSEAIGGTPWRLVFSVPTDSLLAPIAGRRRWGPRGVLLAFALGGLIFVLLLNHNLAGRARQRRLEFEVVEQRKLHERLLAGLSDMGEGVVLVDRDRVLWANDAFCALTGYTRDELLAVPVRTLMAQSVEELDHVRARLAELDAGDGGSLEVQVRRRSGTDLTAEITTKLLGIGAQRLLVVRDVTERKQWEEQLHRANERDRHMVERLEKLVRAARRRQGDLDRVIKVTRELSSRTDARQGICEAVKEVSGAAAALLLEPGGDGDLLATAAAGCELPGSTISIGAEPNGSARAFVLQESVFVADARGDGAMSAELIEATGARTALYEPVMQHGQAVGVLVVIWTERLERFPTEASGIVKLLALETAVAIERADLLAKLHGLARVDGLTGVPNRRVWDEELPRELARARRTQLPLCVAVLDLDRFKSFNDAHGHQAGDRLLKASAAAWQATVRATDLLARYGGEEFALLLPSCPLEDALALADRLRGAVPGDMTVSIGVAHWDGQESADALVARADAALYGAKAAGRDRCVVATPSG